MQSGKRQGEGDDIYMREDGAGTGITHNGDTTDTSVPALDPDIEEQGEGKTESCFKKTLRPTGTELRGSQLK